MEEELTGEVAALMEWINNPDRIIIAGLAKNVITIAADSIQLSDLTQCDFPGYAAQRIQNWIPRIFDDPDYGEALSGELEWVLNEKAAAQNISCVYLTVQEPGGQPTLWTTIPFTPNRKVNSLARFFTFEFRVSSANLADLVNPEVMI